MIKIKSNINLCKIFNVKENELFEITTIDNMSKVCKIVNGELFEDVGYFKGRYYSPSGITVNDIAMIQK